MAVVSAYTAHATLCSAANGSFPNLDSARDGVSLVVYDADAVRDEMTPNVLVHE